MTFQAPLFIAVATMMLACGPRTANDHAGGAGAGAGGDQLAANNYCESAIEMLCSYYLRCERMAVGDGDIDACRTTFDQACNTRYEPYYVDLETRGLLRLSAGGLARCADHLASVACDDQIRDLDGCGGVWVGTVAAGGTCGGSFDRFTCAPGTVCVSGDRGCGVCRVAAAVGDSCNSERPCDGVSACIDGRCVARSGVGKRCDVSRADHCVAGAVCTDGWCTRDALAAPGDACGPGRVCRYRATCVAGVCQQTALLGAPCEPAVGCASGHCSGGVCAPFFGVGAACDNDRACTPGRCDGGRCVALQWDCADSR